MEEEEEVGEVGLLQYVYTYINEYTNSLLSSGALRENKMRVTHVMHDCEIWKNITVCVRGKTVQLRCLLSSPIRMMSL